MTEFKWTLMKNSISFVDKIKALGWEPKITLREGIELTYEWYKKNAI